MQAPLLLLAALSATLRQVPPVPTPEQLAECQSWSVLVGRTIITVVYEDSPPPDPMA